MNNLSNTMKYLKESANIKIKQFHCSLRETSFIKDVKLRYNWQLIYLTNTARFSIQDYQIYFDTCVYDRPFEF